MRFSALPVVGAWLVQIDPHRDDRGFFARLWCRDEFAARGIDIDLPQASLSSNRVAGTLRGMHFARAPAREGKLVRCQRGSVHDVIVDLRHDSATYLCHAAVELSAARHESIWIPPGVAHGFLTLEDDTEAIYLMSESYRPGLADGVRFDDPTFGIRWPRPVAVISERDRTYPDYARTR